MRRFSLIFGLCLAILTVCGCAKDRVDTGKLQIVVSIAPLQEFAEKIGGDKVDVSVMVPAGASPHTYEPTPEQLVSVSKAKVYVKVGSPLEFELSWLDKILSTNRNMLVIDASKGVKFMKMEYEDEEHSVAAESDKQGYDPHIWISPKNARIMAENVYEGLISVDMANKEYYNVNKETYMNELDSLDTYIRQSLSGKTNRKFMVYHPSWGYFARDYGVEQIPIEKGGKEPTGKGIKQVVDQARKDGIKVIFASPQFNTTSAEVIAKELNGRVVLIDPLAKDYVANIRKVAQAFSEAMD